MSNDVRIAYTFMIPEGGGLGGVYLGGTNLGVPLLREGMAIVHDASLKSLPIQDQVQMLAAEKEARGNRGVESGPGSGCVWAAWARRISSGGGLNSRWFGHTL